jgi:hypothetical protein
VDDDNDAIPSNLPRSDVWAQLSLDARELRRVADSLEAASGILRREVEAAAPDKPATPSTHMALLAAASAMSSVLSANRATIDMPRAYWDRLYDAYRVVCEALHEDFERRDKQYRSQRDTDES